MEIHPTCSSEGARLTAHRRGGESGFLRLYATRQKASVIRLQSSSDSAPGGSGV